MPTIAEQALNMLDIAALHSTITESGSSDVACQVALNRFISAAAPATVRGLSIAAGFWIRADEATHSGTTAGTIGAGSGKRFGRPGRTGRSDRGSTGVDFGN